MSRTSSTFISAAMAAAMLTVTMFTSYALWEMHSPHTKRRRLRQKLPKDLRGWRMPGNTPEAEERVWKFLDKVFLEGGLSLWSSEDCILLRSPGNTYPLSSGYACTSGHRTDLTGPGAATELRIFQYPCPSIRAARTRDGHDVIVRVIAIHDEGHDHLKILRKVATGVNSLFSNNHALPMFGEFQFEDIIFGIFPKVGSNMGYLWGSWARNSAGDIVEIIMQMLEALAFIHKLNIAHRDAFKDNFVIQWQPESLKTMSISPSRPRVYLIDFELAIEFSSDCPAEERVVTGYPFDGSAIYLEAYRRPHAPEFATGKTYNPFKLDVWQLASSMVDVRSTIADIDQVLDDMGNANPDQRPDAQGALDSIRKVVNSVPPQSLLIEPWMKTDWFSELQAELQLQKSSNELDTSI